MRKIDIIDFCFSLQPKHFKRLELAIPAVLAALNQVGNIEIAWNFSIIIWKYLESNENSGEEDEKIEKTF